MAGPELKYTETKGKARPEKGAAATTNQVYAMVMEEAKKRGLDWFQPHHAMGMIGSFVQETGNFRKDVIDFDVRGDGGTAHGLMQWRGPRFNNLVKYAEQLKLDPRDLRVQIAFAFEEGSPRSAYVDGGSVRAFKEMETAKDIAGATIAFVHAERPAGYKSNNPAGAHDINKRISHANKAAGIASAEGYRTSDGDYTFTSDSPYANSTYDSRDAETQFGYSPASTYDEANGGSMGDPNNFVQTNRNNATVDELVNTSRLFADSVTGGRGRPTIQPSTPYRSQFGAY